MCLFVDVTQIIDIYLFFAIGQAKAIQTYKNHQLSLTSLVCFIGTLQAIAVTFVVEHNPSVWRIGWDVSLLAAAYAVRIQELHLPLINFRFKLHS